MKRSSWMRIGCMISVFVSCASAYAQTTPCLPCDGPPNPDVAARNIRYERFNRAWSGGDTKAADAAADEFLDGFTFTGDKNPVIKYWIFERGQCDRGRSLLQGDLFLKMEPALEEGAAICELVASGAKPQDSARVLAKIQDARLDAPTSLHWETYDLFARQPTLNLRALQWMRAAGLDDPASQTHDLGALAQQASSGRLENVTRLLELGFDPNALLGKKPKLPLQALIDAPAVDSQVRLEIARVLIRYGADPNKLRWNRTNSTHTAEPDRALEALFADAAAKHDPVRTEFVGFLEESSGGEMKWYAKFRIGNGSDRPLHIRAWVDGDAYLFDGLATDLDYRLPGGEEWKHPAVIEDGYSPRTAVTIPPGESAILLQDWDERYLAAWPAGMQFRLVYSSDRSRHHSQPFKLHDGRTQIDYKALDKPRDWLKRGQDD